MKKWEARSQIFRTMPLRSYFLFCLAVAFTFAAVGVVNDMFDLTHSDLPHLILKVLTASLFAVLWAVALQRHTATLVVLVLAANVVWISWSGRLLPSPHRNFTASDWQTQVAFHGFLILIFVLFSYGWFGTFFQAEGRRYYAAHTEIELASQIQEQLVPPISIHNSTVEIYGISEPSGTVGGDLADAVETGDGTFAYVADVAGHGVAAGVMMSMVKTAVRMCLRASASSLSTLLSTLNETLTPLTATSAYATFAGIMMHPDGSTRYIVAGHPPILLCRSSTASIQRLTNDNLPVAMFPGISYQSSCLSLAEGDVIAIVTDGLTEVFDSKQRELGSAYIEELLQQRGLDPLPAIAHSILEAARQYGKVTDDQTLLLIRWHATTTHQDSDALPEPKTSFQN